MTDVLLRRRVDLKSREALGLDGPRGWTKEGRPRSLIKGYVVLDRVGGRNKLRTTDRSPGRVTRRMFFGKHRCG